MSYFKYIIAVTRENPLYVYLLFALVMAFVLVIGALISTL